MLRSSQKALETLIHFLLLHMLQKHMIYGRLDAPEDTWGSLQLQMDTLRRSPALQVTGSCPKTETSLGAFFRPGQVRKVSWLVQASEK